MAGEIKSIATHYRQRTELLQHKTYAKWCSFMEWSQTEKVNTFWSESKSCNCHEWWYYACYFYGSKVKCLPIYSKIPILRPPLGLSKSGL